VNRKKTIRAATGKTVPDLVLKNATVLDVFTGQWIKADIAIIDGCIAGVGSYDTGRKTRDLKKACVIPGFIDAHVHIESSMVSVPAFVGATAPHGTTTVVADPHEIANVLGTSGINYMLLESKKLLANIYFMIPSCVPATSMETSGATLSVEDIEPYFSHPKVLGLAEVMNYPGVINTDGQVLAKINAAADAGKIIDGHAPGLCGKDLCAYAAAGITSDHECVTPEEALEKIRAGMRVMVREGTGAKNLADLVPAINPQTSQWMMWCTDDRHPNDIQTEGHIDFIVKKAVFLGVNPVTAIQMATIRPAQYFGLHHLGAVAPGKQADLLIISEPPGLDVNEVYCAGKKVAESGTLMPDIRLPAPAPCPSPMRVDVNRVNFNVIAGQGKARVIRLVPGQIVTKCLMASLPEKNGLAMPDPGADIAKIAVVERHIGTGNIGVGFVSGFGLAHGAIAQSIAHDSHNIIVCGATDADMKAAVAAVVKMGGGIVVVDSGRTLSSLPLPIAGLMSNLPMGEVSRKMDGLNNTAKALGSKLSDPFMALSFLALPVIPKLKITDLGLFDVEKFCHVPVYG